MITLHNGIASWTSRPGDKFLVTGRGLNGSRFTIRCASWHYAKAINIYTGTKWLVRDGRRHAIQRATA